MSTVSGTLRPRTPRLVLAMIVISVIATPVLLAPYATLDPAAGRVDVPTEPLLWLLVVHVFTAATAMFLGLLQLVPRIRARRRVHRRIGRAFLTIGTVAFVGTGIPLALATPSGNLTRIGVLVPAVLLPVTAGIGWRAIRRGEVPKHRDWMIRTFALAWFAITARLVVPLMMLLQLPILRSAYEGEVERMVEATVPLGQWLGWIVNLTVAEWVIRRKLRTPRPGPVAGEAVARST